MTKKELSEILKQDPYFKKRVQPTGYEDDLFLREVGFHCPLCGKDIRPRNREKDEKKYEIAHIYPNKPTVPQYEILKNAERLGDNSESIKNKIALCLDCHNKQDYRTSLNDYNKLLEKKKSLIVKADLEDAAQSLTLEDEIRDLIEKLQNLPPDKPIDLNYKPVSLANKFLPEEQIVKAKIENYVKYFFPFIRECLQDLEKSGTFHQIVLAQQIKTCYIKMSFIDSNKQLIFDQIVDWVKNATSSESKGACEAVVAFYVQNCEVFDEITK